MVIRVEENGQVSGDAFFGVGRTEHGLKVRIIVTEFSLGLDTEVVGALGHAMVNAPDRAIVIERHAGMELRGQVI